MKCIFILKRTFISIVVSLLVLGCTKDDFEEQEQSIEITSVVEILLQRGFNLKDIIETKEHYIVEGDIIFSKKIEDYGNLTIRTDINQNLNITENNFTTSVYFRDNELVDVGGTTRTISVYLPDDPLFLFSTSEDGGGGGPSEEISGDGNGNCLGEDCPGIQINIWREPLQMAMNDWNVENSCFTFVLALTEQESDITIVAVPGSGTNFGLTSFPMNGNPFPQINILAGNPSLNNSFNARRNLLAHELGHTIGFRHTGGGDGGIELEGAPTSTDGGSVMTVQANVFAIASQGVSASDRDAIVALCAVNNNGAENSINGPSEICRQIDRPLLELTTYSLTYNSLDTEWMVSSPNDILEIVSQNETSVTVRPTPTGQPFGNLTSLFGPTVEATIKAINSSGGVIAEKTITIVGDPLNNSNQTINGPISLNIGETSTFNVIPLGFDHFNLTSVSWSIFHGFDTLFAIPSDDFQIQSNGFTAQVTPLPTATGGNGFGNDYVIAFKLRNDCGGIITLFKSITIAP
ncbi:hypothetical protein D7030_07585 [Flavobacteriaceae bacterium AU392]|nr:hypothetical protein D1817_00835 [Flavobacteriaceae bacterium]RKM84984.1 hypothetical protein D7030_07585 [Flavobacteriaceae bacterium AU392]